MDEFVNTLENVHKQWREVGLSTYGLAMSAGQQEITAAQIARRAGLGRSAVANWRKRYPDFPKPVGGTTGSPTFSWPQVETWLRSVGKGSHNDVAAWNPHTVSESAGVAPPGELARIVASLLPAGVRGEVFDPACGEGRLLQAVADRFGDRVKLSGEESDDAAAAVAALAFRSRIDGTHAEIRIGGSIRGGAASQCAAVVCDVQASRLASRYGEIAWVQHCLAQLRSGAVAVLVVSARTCIQKSGEAIRTELIRSGALRHVIALPTTASVGSCIWILRQPAEATDAAPVRVIDLTALADIADVPQDFAAWKIVDEALVRAVPRQELLANGSSVLPSDYVRPVHFPAGDIDGFVSRVKDLHEKAAVAFPRFAAGARPDGPNVDIAELERAGALLIRSRDTTPRKGDVLIRTLGRPPVVATGGEREQAGVAHVIETDPSRPRPVFRRDISADRGCSVASWESLGRSQSG